MPIQPVLSRFQEADRSLTEHIFLTTTSQETEQAPKHSIRSNISLDSIQVMYISCLFLHVRSLCMTCDEVVVLQLRLALDSWNHEVSNITSSLVEEVAHALSTEALADNIPLEAVLVDHVGHSSAVVSTSETPMSEDIKTYPHPSSMT